MKVLVTRTSQDRMTDMYVIRFPGHPNRIMPFRKSDWEAHFSLRLPRGGSREVNLKLEEMNAN